MDDGFAIKRLGGEKYKVVAACYENLTDIDVLSSDATVAWLAHKVNSFYTVQVTDDGLGTTYFLKVNLHPNIVFRVLFLLMQEMAKDGG